MLIYLGDITYDQKSTQAPVPLNAAYVAAHAQRKFGDQVTIKLFKSPEKLLSAIDEQTPDILGLSHYIWNDRLNEFVINYARKICKNLIVVAGGPNFKNDKISVQHFLKNNKEIDYLILFAGEVPFTNLIEHFWASKPAKRVKGANIIGCFTLNDTDQLIGEPYVDNRKELDYLPSPYLNGWLEPFLKDGYLPIFETNRGCPYSCSFCVWGIHALAKVKQFSLERVFGELDYVYGLGLSHVQWLFADANFGILKRDAEIAKRLRQMHEKRPDAFSYVDIFWAKNPTPTMTEVAQQLQDLTMGYIAFQSLDDTVLSAIERKNISTERLMAFVEEIKKHVSTIHTDLLVGLPEETYQSNLNSYGQALSFGFTSIGGGEVRMLPGSSMDSDTHRKKFGLKTKFRISASDVGVWRGNIVYELEEVIRETDAMSESEMVKLRVVRSILYCGTALGYLLPAFVATKALENVDLVSIVSDMVDAPSDKFPKLSLAMSEMRKLAEEEFFESEDSADRYMSNPDIYENLVNEPPVKFNYWIATKLAIDPSLRQEFDQFIIQNLIFQGLAPTVAKDLLRLCQAVRLVDLILDGNAEASSKAKISRETSSLLKSEGYIHAKAGSDIHFTISQSRFNAAKHFINFRKDINFKYLSNIWGTINLPFLVPLEIEKMEVNVTP